MRILFPLLFLIFFRNTSADTINTNLPSLNWNASLHLCSDAMGVTPMSPVSSNIKIPMGQSAFQNTVNKSLACCLNSSNSSHVYFPPNPMFEKFDCKERPLADAAGVPYTFDQLWARTNDGSQYGIPIAIALRNSAGERLTGFFTSDLQRCNNYSEFNNGEVIPGRVSAAMTSGIQQSGPSSGTFQATGTAIAHASSGWSTIVSGPWAANTEVTQAPNCTHNPSECRRCNIYIRAVALAKCPANTPTETYTLTSNPGTSNEVKHCSVANEVTIRIHGQQIFEVGGKMPMKEFDTELDSRAVSTISVRDIYR